MASTSQSKRCESETVPKRPVMPRDIFDAAIKGDRDVLIERLGLQTDEQKEIQEDGDSNHESIKDLPFGSEIIPLTQTTSPFATKSNDSAPEKIRTRNQIFRSELQSATRFGDTVLHLLVTNKMNNELALMVFERDPSLLKTQNMMLETPLHCAAEVGNEKVIQMLIRMEPSVVKDALQEKNEKGDTAFHVALRYNFADICCNLMQLDSEIAYEVSNNNWHRVNNEMFSPFHIAIDENRDLVAVQMLCVDPILACTKLPNGMFPVHFAACKKNSSMVLYFMENFPDYAELVDYRGRNIFHLVAEEADEDDFFHKLLINYKDMTTRMNNATTYEGNTPLHIAAMKGHRRTMRFIWKNMTSCVAATIKNKRGLTPYEVSRNQLKEIWKDSWPINFGIWVHELLIGDKISEGWFMYATVPRLGSLENKWERIQVIGLGSVLIITVTFAAAFTIPGGYNQDHGTPILERRYMFWAFILADTLAFLQGFISLLALLGDALPGPTLDTLEFSSNCFLLAANSMVMAFGLGLYVTLAPGCLSIAIIVLVLTMLIGSPVLFIVLGWTENMKIFTRFFYNPFSLFALFASSLMFIYFVALLSL